MDLIVCGKQLNIGAVLRGRVADGLAGLEDRLGVRLIGATVTVSRDRHLYRIDCHVERSGGDILAHGEASDVYAGLDACLERLATRLRRDRQRLRSRFRSHPAIFGRTIPASVDDGLDAAESRADDTASLTGRDPSGLHTDRDGYAV